MRYQAPRGTHDVLPAESHKWQYVEAVFRELCRTYGYGELRTPVFEETDLFVRTSGETSDIVTKQMYTFKDPSGDSLTLRPEGTPPTIRAYVEHSLGAQQPVNKLYYIAPMFRYERPQAGRFRQHLQVGVEILGVGGAAADAEILCLGRDFLHRLGITGESLHLNSVGCPACRPAYREALLAALRAPLPQLCDDCQRRYEMNPLRLLDCKNERCRELTAGAPGVGGYLCVDCANHFADLQSALALYEIPFELDSRLVRGLDYYTRTAFEFLHGGLGAQSAVIAGGRYDGLVEACGGEPTPGIGFGCGVERILLAMEAVGVTVPESHTGSVFVAPMGPATRDDALRLLRRLREAGIASDTDYLGRSLKAQMREANRNGAALAVIVGQNELSRGTVTLRDMRSSQQTEVPLEQVVEEIRNRL